MLIKRREVLSGLGSIGMMPLLCKSVSAAESVNADTGIILVVVYLGGGNDGLNTVVPLNPTGSKNLYGQYYKLRTPASPPQGQALAYAESDLQLLAFNADYTKPALACSEYAFAPSMLAMRDLYTTGHLAVINGIGLPAAEQNALSHQNASLDWLTGQININTGLTTPPGWLGLALDGVKGGNLGAMASLSGTTPLLIGAKAQGIVLNPPIDYFGVNFGVSDNGKAIAAEFAKIAALAPASSSATFDQGMLATALADVADVKTIAKAQRATNYPLESWLDYQFRDVARLILGGSGMRGYFVAQGGYDTHSSQATQQPVLLQQFSQSLVNFYEFLQGTPAASKVVVATVSDFGRRPAANLGFGTDHGGATVSFVFGEPVKGGVFGTYPSLTKFDQNGNLQMNIDFRNLIYDLILKMGFAPPSYLGDWSKSPIGF